MPSIADPYATHHRRSSTTDDRLHGARTRVGVALHRKGLTRALAEGAETNASEALALRAAQLTSEHHRRALAQTLRRTLAEAHRPRIGRSAGRIIRPRAVFEARDSIESMIERLSSSERVSAAGMARLERILTNADNSPLYNSSSPGALARELTAATDAMESGVSDSHEFMVGI